MDLTKEMDVGATMVKQTESVDAELTVSWIFLSREGAAETKKKKPRG